MNHGKRWLAMLLGLCLLIPAALALAAGEGQPISYVTFDEVKAWYQKWDPDATWREERLVHLEFEGHNAQYHCYLDSDFRGVLSFSCTLFDPEPAEAHVEAFRSISEVLGEPFPEEFYQGTLNRGYYDGISSSGKMMLYSDENGLYVNFEMDPSGQLPTLDRLLSAVIRSGLQLSAFYPDHDITLEAILPYNLSIYLNEDGSLRQFTAGFRQEEDGGEYVDGQGNVIALPDAKEYFHSAIDLLTEGDSHDKMSESLDEHYEAVLQGSENDYYEFCGKVHSVLRSGNYQLEFIIIADRIPDDAATFSSGSSDAPDYRQYIGISSDSPLALAESEEEAERIIQAMAQEAADAHAKEIAAAFDGIETVPIEPTTLLDAEGLKVTLAGLIYSEDNSQQPAIGATFQVEKAEGVTLEAFSIQGSKINQYNYNLFFNTEQIPVIRKSEAARVEVTLWTRLADIQAKVYGFQGISSMDLSVTAMLEGGESIGQDNIIVQTDLPEAALPGRELFSAEGITVQLSGKTEMKDGNCYMEAFFTNDTDEDMFLTTADYIQINGLEGGWKEVVFIDLPAHQMQTDSLVLYATNLPSSVPAMENVETAEFIPLLYTPDGEKRLARVTLTSQDLGFEAAVPPANEYAAEFPEQVLATTQDGLQLRLMQLAQDGVTFVFQLDNPTSETMAVLLENAIVNGEKLPDQFSVYSRPGSSDRAEVNFVKRVPEITSYDQISMDITFCRQVYVPEWESYAVERIAKPVTVTILSGQPAEAQQAASIQSKGSNSSQSTNPASSGPEELTVTAENGQTTLSAGKKLKLAAAFATDSSATKAQKKKGFTWTVLDAATGAVSGLAKVDKKGVLTAGKKIAAPTEVEVRAVSKAINASGSIRVTLMPTVTKVSASPETLIFYAGEDRAAQVEVLLTPDTVPAQGLAWQAKPAGIAQITETENGAEIHPLAQGKTVLTVKEPGGKTAKVTVNVLLPVESVTLTAKGKAKPGGKVTLSAAILPKQAGDKNVTWDVDVDESIASISSKGVLTISKTAPTGTVITVSCTASGAPEPIVETMEITVED